MRKFNVKSEPEGIMKFKLLFIRVQHYIILRVCKETVPYQSNSLSKHFSYPECDFTLKMSPTNQQSATREILDVSLAKRAHLLLESLQGFNKATRDISKVVVKKFKIAEVGEIPAVYHSFKTLITSPSPDLRWQLLCSDKPFHYEFFRSSVKFANLSIQGGLVSKGTIKFGKNKFSK